MECLIFIRDHILPLVPLLTPLLTPIVAATAIIISFKQYQYQKYLGYIEKQLDTFYGPMLGCITYLDANRAYKQLIAEKEMEVINDEELGEFLDRKVRTRYIVNSINYDNKIFYEKIFPQYQQMLNLFTNHSSSILPETMEYHYTLYKFVEIWERSNAEVLNNEVLKRLDHSEKYLMPFYDHIRETVTTLQKELLGGRQNKRHSWVNIKLKLLLNKIKKAFG